MTSEAAIRIQVEFRSGIPVTSQICEQIHEQIIRGELNPGQRLPTVRELAKEINVNFNTVARAYRILDESGWISAQQGRGTFILPKTDPAYDTRMQALDQKTKEYLDEVERIGVSPEEAMAVFCRNLKNWQKDRPAAHKNRNGGAPQDNKNLLKRKNVSRETFTGD